MASGSTHKAKGGRKNRKHGRNYRVNGDVKSVTKYRARHGIPAGRRKDNHANRLCRAHTRA